VAASPPIEDVAFDRTTDQVSAEYMVRQHLSNDTLTDSELTVINLIAQGATNPRRRAATGLLPYTMKTHLHNAFAKLGITSSSPIGAQLTRGAEWPVRQISRY
jgi:ATP/maltotriose-dependent transcriptional regulator MalT